MSSVETGQVSAVKTGQMSAAETGQMSSVARTDICLVSIHNVEVSEVSIVPIPHCSSLRSFNCGNITMFKSQIGGLALNHQKNAAESFQETTSLFVPSCIEKFTSKR